MKTKLNLICFLLFCALGVSLSLNIIGGLEGTNEAWQIIRKENTEQNKKDKTYVVDLYTVIRLAPTIPGSYPDSIYNDRAEKWIPVQYNEIITRVDKEFTKSELILVLLLLLTSLAAMIMGFVEFVKLIRNINRSEIFEWSNVRHLKRLGFAFLVVFAINLLFSYLNYSSILEQVNVRGYKIDWSSAVQTYNLVIGLASLLVAEIFAIGLRLKEEQDLTI